MSLAIDGPHRLDLGVPMPFRPGPRGGIRARCPHSSPLGAALLTLTRQQTCHVGQSTTGLARTSSSCGPVRALTGAV